jgi:hypothetical protein
VLACEWCCGAVAALLPLGLLRMTPSLRRTLVDSWKTWTVVLGGMGAFKALARQVTHTVDTHLHTTVPRPFRAAGRL